MFMKQGMSHVNMWWDLGGEGKQVIMDQMARLKLFHMNVLG